MSGHNFIGEPLPILSLPSDELSQLELRVARRADELAHLAERRDRKTDLEFWHRAEREVFGRELDQMTAA